MSRVQLKQRLFFERYSIIQYKIPSAPISERRGVALEICRDGSWGKVRALFRPTVRGTFADPLADQVARGDEFSERRFD